MSYDNALYKSILHYNASEMSLIVNSMQTQNAKIAMNSVKTSCSQHITHINILLALTVFLALVSGVSPIDKYDPTLLVY